MILLTFSIGFNVLLLQHKVQITLTQHPCSCVPRCLYPFRDHPKWKIQCTEINIEHYRQGCLTAFPLIFFYKHLLFIPLFNLSTNFIYTYDIWLLITKDLDEVTKYTKKYIFYLNIFKTTFYASYVMLTWLFTDLISIWIKSCLRSVMRNIFLWIFVYVLFFVKNFFK